jgi:hypothetical protein
MLAPVVFGANLVVGSMLLTTSATFATGSTFSAGAEAVAWTFVAAGATRIRAAIDCA